MGWRGHSYCTRISKSKIGKRLERAIARASLTLVGLVEERDFRLNLPADREVERETDVEITTPRGAIRMELGLIGKGNPEVIGDKVNRVGRNGIVMFDLLAAGSSTWDAAEAAHVRLIQMRNNNPAEELRGHLGHLNVGVVNEPIQVEKVAASVSELSLEIFE